MKANLIVLKTQESQEAFYTSIEPTLTRKMAQNGVEISKTIIFKSSDEFNKSLFALLESCSIIVVDMSIENIGIIFNQLDKFYGTQANQFSQGKIWIDQNVSRTCIMFDMNEVDFVNKLDTKFLKQIFAPTKFLTLIKTYGLDESEIKKVFLSIPNPENFEWYITSNFLDCEISILAEADYYNSNQICSYIRHIYEILSDYIYSDNDESLFDKLEELLSVRNTKLSICDSLTNGIFQTMMINNLRNYNQKVITFYNINKTEDYINDLKISPQFLGRYELNSVEVIYEMATSLIENTPCNIALVLAGTIERPFIAVGDSEAIHLYKFHFNHTHSLINNIMIQTSIFKLIKKMKKMIDFFEKM